MPGSPGRWRTARPSCSLAYVTARAHALFDFRLYLPKAWCADRDRRERARVPEDVPFTTKPALGTAMIAGAAGAGVPFAWVAGDEVYGRSSKLREACEKDRKGVRARGPGELHRHPALRPEDDRGCRGPADPARRRGRPARAGAAARATATTPGPGPRQPPRGTGS